MIIYIEQKTKLIKFNVLKQYCFNDNYVQKFELVLVEYVTAVVL